MAEQRDTQAEQATEELVEEGSIVDRLLETIDTGRAVTRSEEDRQGVGRAVAYVVDIVAKSAERPDRIDGQLIDSFIAELDRKLGEQLDEVLHHEEFQRLESAWRGLYFLVDRTDFETNTQIHILNASKEELTEDFEYVGDPLEGGLFTQMYRDRYDQYGAEPVSVVVANYDFDNSTQDIALMRNIADVASACHTPVITAAGPTFFGRESFEDLSDITRLETIFDSPAYLNWKNFRESENSRYINLTVPKFLLRVPYGEGTIRTKGFEYAEGVKAEEHEKYLWGNAAFALAANINASFAGHGWPSNIVGPKAGGLVDNLPIHVYEVGEGIQQYKIPLEIKIGDMLEVDLAEHGFIPLLVHEAKKVQGCFFSAYSAQEPKEYDDDVATANARLSTRLPYMLLVSRVAHYLRVIQRDEIGRTRNASQVQDALNRWIGEYVSGPNVRSEEVRIRQPFQYAQVEVTPSPDKPGVFDVAMFLTPHFHSEEFNVQLSLVAEMPEARS